MMRRILATAGLLLFFACEASQVAPVSPPEPEGEVTSKTKLTVVDIIQFTREVEPGVAVGFDLDDRVSTDGDEESCGHADFVSPDGTEGIDNQLAIITPLFDTVGIGAIEDFVQDAVESGGLLMMWEISDLDDLENDPEVTVTLRFGMGTPLLGTDGLLLSGQTFRPNPDKEAVVIQAKLENGRITTESFDGKLPIKVFHVHYELELKDARMSAELTFDGGLINGVMGGKVPLSNLMAIAVVADGEAGGILDSVTFVLEGMGDMDRDADGKCQALSAALAFSAVSGFFYQDAGD